MRRALSYADLLIAASLMNMAPHSFIHDKRCRLIKEWCKIRIITLIDTMSEDGANALCKEFHIDEKPRIPAYYRGIPWLALLLMSTANSIG